ncbi:hypothetical protein [Dyella sp. C9]|uniref:hypothetical protein n=1 Tax=Dyella sp. C9 TaxID=2202154 RepID=UPI001300AA75|nr:hypothetical protein [Dyella sp. C9]
MALIVASSGALAEGCVSGVVVVGTRHGDNSAIGEVVFVKTYPSIEACNESMTAASRNPLSFPAPGGSAPFASFTFVCKLPPDCGPPDVGQVQPMHKVLIWAK